MLECFGTNKHKDRNNLDFYTTPPSCVEDIIKAENLHGIYILENSAGNGHIAEILADNGNRTMTVDIVSRDYELDYVCDFLEFDNDFGHWFDCAVYNPPFKLLNDFIKKTWEFTDRQIIFCRLQVLETQKRYDEIFKHGYLEKIYVYRKRQICGGGGCGTMCFCWVVLDKNNKSEPVVRWL